MKNYLKTELFPFLNADDIKGTSKEFFALKKNNKYNSIFDLVIEVSANVETFRNSAIESPTFAVIAKAKKLQ